MAVDTDKLAKAIAEAAEEYERQYGRLPSKAKVTLSKSDEQLVPEGYAIVKREEAKAEVIRKTVGNLALAEKAEARLGELRKADPLTTYEEAVSVVLDENPDLYVP